MQRTSWGHRSKASKTSPPLSNRYHQKCGDVPQEFRNVCVCVYVCVCIYTYIQLYAPQGHATALCSVLFFSPPSFCTFPDHEHESPTLTSALLQLRPQPSDFLSASSTPYPSHLFILPKPRGILPPTHLLKHPLTLYNSWCVLLQIDDCIKDEN